jgi:hypothetical protein
MRLQQTIRWCECRTKLMRTREALAGAALRSAVARIIAVI